MRFITAIIFVFPMVALAGISCDEFSPFEEKIVVPLNLSSAKVDARFDETKPLKQAVESFVRAHPDWKFNEIVVISSSARTPLAMPKSVKSALDVRRAQLQNELSNKQLSEVRKSFAEKSMAELKSSTTLLSSVKIHASSEVLGPQFIFHPDPRKHDQNLKFVVPQFSSGYEIRVAELYEAHKADYLKVGITQKEQLLDKENFKSLYEVKFKAFQGYVAFIKGKKKSGIICGKSGPAVTAPASKQ